MMLLKLNHYNKRILKSLGQPWCCELASVVYVAICSLFVFIERRLRSGFHSPKLLFGGMFSVETWIHWASQRSTAKPRQHCITTHNPSIVLESRGWWATFMLLFEIQNSKLQLPLGSTPASGEVPTTEVSKYARIIALESWILTNTAGLMDHSGGGWGVCICMKYELRSSEAPRIRS
jgi:hypothetical protein